MKHTRFAQESAAQAQVEAQHSEPEKPKLVQIALSESHLYALASDGRLFEASLGTGQWKQLPLPRM